MMRFSVISLRMAYASGAVASVFLTPSAAFADAHHETCDIQNLVRGERQNVERSNQNFDCLLRKIVSLEEEPETDPIPLGTVAFFKLESCPFGWTSLEELQGRYIVGLPERGELAARVGQPLTNRESRSVGVHVHALTSVEAHSHTLSDAGQHTHSYSSTNNGPLHDNGSNFIGGAQRFGTVGTKTTTGAGAHNHNLRAAGAHGHELEAAGSVQGTTAPYLQLLACEKE